MRYIAVSFSGRALTWWSNNVKKITTLKELEEQLRLRFDQETNILANINLIQRRQRADEPLLDFIDEKLFIMQRIRVDMPDDSKILNILADVHEKYTEHFLVSGLEFYTIEQFTRFAASLVRMLRSKDD